MESGITSPKFYVYVYRVGGIFVYVGKGSGNRMRQHLYRSHNKDLNEILSYARAEGRLIQARIVKANLTEMEALQLEADCYVKWQPLCNKINPLTKLENDAIAAEWEALDKWLEDDEGYQAFAQELDQRVEAMNAINDGELTYEEAVRQGKLD